MPTKPNPAGGISGVHNLNSKWPFWSSSVPQWAKGVTKTATLQDDFVQLDTSTRWTGSGTYTILSDQLRLVSLAAGTGYSGVVSRLQYDLTESYILVKPTPSPISGTHECMLEFNKPDGSTKLTIKVSGTGIYYGQDTGGSGTVNPRAYSASTDAWWRISETGGTVTFAVSADCNTWNTLGTVSTPAWANAGYIQLFAGHYAVEAANTDTFFDNLNVIVISGIPITVNMTGILATANGIANVPTNLRFFVRPPFATATANQYNPPNFVEHVETAVWDGNALNTNIPVNSVLGQAGDLILACCMANSGSGINFVTPTNSGTALTWTLLDSNTTASTCAFSIWSAVLDTTRSITVNFKCTNYSHWGGYLNLWRNHNGTGATSKVTGDFSSPYTTNITTTAINSAIDITQGDFAGNKGNFVPVTAGVSSYVEKLRIQGLTTYSVYNGYYDAVGVIGTKTVGSSAPASGDMTIFAVEVKGLTTLAYSLKTIVKPLPGIALGQGIATFQERIAIKPPFANAIGTANVQTKLTAIVKPPPGIALGQSIPGTPTIPGSGNVTFNMSGVLATALAQGIVPAKLIDRLQAQPFANAAAFANIPAKLIDRISITYANATATGNIPSKYTITGKNTPYAIALGQGIVGTARVRENQFAPAGTAIGLGQGIVNFQEVVRVNPPSAIARGIANPSSGGANSYAQGVPAIALGQAIVPTIADRENLSGVRASALGQGIVQTKLRVVVTAVPAIANAKGIAPKDNSTPSSVAGHIRIRRRRIVKRDRELSIP